MPTAPKSQQRGAALVVGLIMMLLLTIIGLSAMQGTSMQEKMSGNMRDTSLALNSAEASLRYAEEGLLKSMNVLERGKDFATCTNNCEIINSYRDFSGSSAAMTAWQNRSATWTNMAQTYGSMKDATGNTITLPTGSRLNTSNNGAVVAANPQVLVEYVNYKGDSLDQGKGVAYDTGLDYFRNTAVANGGSTTSEVTLQTVFARRFR